MIGPPTGDFHPIYNAPMLGAHKRIHRIIPAAEALGLTGDPGVKTRKDENKEEIQLACRVRFRGLNNKFPVPLERVPEICQGK
jgi:hypothetical protein